MKSFKHINEFDETNKTTVFHDISINEFKLKEGWLRQAQLHTEYAFEALEKRKQRDLIARKIKVKHAELNLDVRKSPVKYVPALVKKDKTFRLTESIVESAIEANLEYQKLNRIYIEKDFQYAMYKSIVDALSDKCKSLEEIQYLVASSLRAEPSDEKVRKRLDR